MTLNLSRVCGRRSEPKSACSPMTLTPFSCMLVLELIAVHLMRQMETRLTFLAENAAATCYTREL